MTAYFYQILDLIGSIFSLHAGPPYQIFGEVPPKDYGPSLSLTKGTLSGELT